MFRSIIWYVYFFLSIFLTIPAMFKVKSLTRQGLEEERKAFVQQYTAKWARSLLKLAGVKVTVHGLENLPKDKTVLFIGNHQGNFDIPIYMSQIDVPKGFVAKIETSKIPGVKTWMEYMHCVFMDRSNIRKAGEAIIHGIKNLKAGYSMVIFPEGTRSRGDKTGDFKAGSFKLATKSKVPIVPVTMNGSYKIMESTKGPWLTPANVELFIHPMIETSNLSKEELDQLPKKVQSIIESKLPNN